jgi:hypothetical protein
MKSITICHPHKIFGKPNQGERYGQKRNVYKVLIGKPEGKQGVGRTRRGWEYIKMDLQEARLQGVNWVNIAQDMDKYGAPVNTLIVPGLHKIRRTS